MLGDLTKKHEGLRLWVYTDTRGNKTIGRGFNLQGAGARSVCLKFGLDYDALFNGKACLTQEQADAIFDFQFEAVQAQAAITFPGFAAMPVNVQEVICDLIFNMGWATFQEFRQTIAALKARDWHSAALDLVQSLWAEQVGRRAIEDISLLEEA